MGFSEESEVKYADAASGAERNKIIVRISGGRDAKIEDSIMIFEKANRSYPVGEVTDEVVEVSSQCG